MLKLLLILGDDPISYCGGLGIRFNKMIHYLEDFFDIKIYSVFPIDEGIRKVSKTEVYTFKSFNHIKYANMFGFRNHQGHLLTGLNVSKIIQEINWTPDIVLCSDHGTALAGLYISKIFNCKFVMEFDLALFSYEKIYDKNTLSELNKFESTFISEIEHMSCLESDLVIMCSEYYEKVCPYKMKKVVTVENGIELDEFNNITQEEVNQYNFPSSNESSINIVFIGRFNSQKGLHLLFNTYVPENVNIYFVGSNRGGDLYEVILDLCKVKKNYYYLGEKIDKEKIIIMKKADAILFPSLHEPFGIVGLETMACKTLCITTRVDGIATYMDKDMCIEIENGNLQKAIYDFLNMSKQEKERRINRAYERVKQYTWQKISNKFVKILNDLMRNKPNEINLMK